MDSNTIQAIADAVLAKLASGSLKPRLLTVAQAAVYLGRTEKAIRHLVVAGSLPAVRSDTRVMLDVQDLDKWIEANKWDTR